MDETVGDRVLRWIRQEGWPIEPAKPAPDEDWRFLLMRNGLRLVVYHEPAKERIAITLGCALSDQERGRIAELGPFERDRIYFSLRRVAHAGGQLGVSIDAEKETHAVRGWSIDATLYDETITHQAFHDAILRLVSRHIELVDACNEMEREYGIAE